MKKTLLALITVAVGGCHSQEKQKMEVPKDIITTKTANHVNIPGTRLYVIPAEGFGHQPFTTNMAKGDAATIQFMEIQGSNYYQNAEVSTREELESQGSKVTSFRTLRLNKYQAKISNFSNGTNVWNMGVLFGDSSFTVIVMAVYDHDVPGLENEVTSMLSSIYYDKDTKPNPLDIASFTVDESKSRFKYARLAAGLFIYTMDGLVRDVYLDEPTILISMLPDDIALNVKEISDNQLKLVSTHSGYTDIKVRKSFQIKINGKQACIVDADVKINGRDALLHQTVIKGDTRIIIAQASIKSDYDATLKEVKKFEMTLKIKE